MRGARRGSFPWRSLAFITFQEFIRIMRKTALARLAPRGGFIVKPCTA